ncbi:hypothetical protein Q4560_15590 [Celeribacter halophilus]|uniref:hypothetical protein n=1 Tax=Celeribacter halophilus TaxID=576117 RepID=UPI0026E24F51|nr:hypothetical protein [Celeribacter halophilus]MDO6724694.1 hypothetical protein [Celeribacter halophilus]
MTNQNKSHAVMAQRSEAKDSLDNFPTPPWATRALVEHVIERGNARFLSSMSCLEPACGAGHMAKTLAEYFGTVSASDIYSYGYGKVENFLDRDENSEEFDWVITNPPFKYAEEFISKALKISNRGVAMLVRTVFIESVGRYNRIFSKNPPQKFAQFSERVPMVKGRLDKKASTATGYSWIVWEKNISPEPRLLWVPPCRKSLEREEDYLEDLSSGPVSEHYEASLKLEATQKTMF